MLNKQHYELIGRRAVEHQNNAPCPGASTEEQAAVDSFFTALRGLQQADAAARAAGPEVPWGTALARFRASQAPPKRSPFFFLLWGAVPSAALSAMLLFALLTSSPVPEQGMESLTPEEITEIAAPYEVNFLESRNTAISGQAEAALDEEIAAELNLTPDEAASFINDDADGYGDLLNSLTPEEVDALYNNTTTKKKEG